MRNILLAAGLCLLAFAAPAHAACNGPPGSAGDMIYSADYHVPQYCNGGAWVAMGTPGASPTIQNGLAGYWKLDDGSGASASDSSGNANPAALTNSPAWTPGGQRNGALTFNGIDQYAQTPDVAVLRLAGSWTDSAWVYLTALPGGGNISVIVTRAETGGGTNYGIGVDNGVVCGVGMAWTVWNNNPTDGTPAVCTAATINLNTWYLVTGTYDANTKKQTLYINGQQVGQNTQTAAPDSGTGFGVSIGYDDCCGGSGFTAGTIDEARVYGHALSAQEVLDLYNWSKGNVDPFSGLVHRWKFDELAGLTAADSAGNFNGTLLNGASFSAAGKIGGTVFINASDDGNDDNNPELDLGTSFDFPAVPFTLSAWINPTNYNDYRTIIGKRDIGTNDHLQWQLQNGTGTVGLFSAATSFQFAYVPPTSAWTHLAVTVSAAAASLYVNGVLNETQAGTFAFFPCTVTCHAAIGDNGEYLTRGAGVGADSDPFKGYIDDLRVYNRDLSPAEILSLYKNSGANLTCSNPVGTEGDIIYSAGTRHVLQFCGLSGWQALGPVPGAGGGGCLNPAGSEGDIRYNSTYSAMQYCDGTSWRQMPNSNYVPARGLIAYWKLDEPSGAAAADSSGNGNTMTLFNAPAWNTTSGHNNGMLQFNGTNQYGATASTLNLSGTNAVTVSLWLNYTYTLSGNGPELFELSDNFNSYTDSFLMYDSEATCTGLAVSNRAIVIGLKGNVGYNTACFNPPTDNVWHHLVAVFDTSQAGASETKLYIDGVLQSATVRNFSNDNTNNFGNRTFYLQARGGTIDFAAGKVDEFRIYNRALDANEIIQLYNGI